MACGYILCPTYPTLSVNGLICNKDFFWVTMLNLYEKYSVGAMPMDLAEFFVGAGAAYEKSLSPLPQP
jgi:hypothetical protein